MLLKKERVFDRKKYSNEIDLLIKKKEDSSRVNYKNRNYPRYDNQTKWKNYNHKNTYSQPKKGERFVFDPNQASAVEWARLGVSEKTVATIQKYLSKGGSFRSPDDLKKIWGIPASLAEELMPYVKIEARENTLNEAETQYFNDDKKRYVPKMINPVDVNTADSLSWEALPTIGPALTKRILTYKEKLGGFHSTEQIREVFGITDSSFNIIAPFLRLEEKEIKKININTATLEELKIHPYIRYRLANAIVEYRNQHGPYSSVAGLKRIMLITDEVLMKIAPYLVVQ